MSLEENFQDILRTIALSCRKVNRSSEEVKPIWVTKSVSHEKVRELFQLGPKRIGENRAGELKKKVSQLEDYRYECHFLGHLQSNKIKEVIPHVDYLHSLDRISLAEKINQFLIKKNLPSLKALIQVNISGEETKQGIKREEMESFLKAVIPLEKIQLVGLMTMAPFTKDESMVRSCFKSLRELGEEMQARFAPKITLSDFSMGMSNDFEIAIEEGATFIRIGRKLFGERVYAK